MLGEIGVGAIILGWIGSIELRARSFVNKDRFGDLKEQTGRIETKIDTLLLNVATHTEIVKKELNDKE